MSEPKPYTRPGPFYCGNCGDQMMIIGSRAHHREPSVWVCRQCKRAWCVPVEEAIAGVIALPWSVVGPQIDAYDAAALERQQRTDMRDTR